MKPAVSAFLSAWYIRAAMSKLGRAISDFRIAPDVFAQPNCLFQAAVHLFVHGFDKGNMEKWEVVYRLHGLVVQDRHASVGLTFRLLIPDCVIPMGRNASTGRAEIRPNLDRFAATNIKVSLRVFGSQRLLNMSSDRGQYANWRFEQKDLCRSPSGCVVQPGHRCRNWCQA